MKIIFFVLVGASIALCSPLFAMGDRPTFEQPTAEARSAAVTPTASASSSIATSSIQNVAASSNAALSAAVTKLPDDVMYELERSYDDQIKQRQFADAYVTLLKIPEQQRSRKKQLDFQYLKLFKGIEEEVASMNPLLKKEDDLDDATKKTVTRLYKDAQLSMIQGKSDVAKDLLIQVLFLSRRDAKAKKLLEYGLDLRAGGYKVEDMQAKYWNKSSTLFYGGNYISAVEALNVLLLFDKDDPVIYERLGSAYYMMSEKQKAVESWTTALYFNPKNTELQKVLQKAKDVMAQEELDRKQQEQSRKKVADTAAATQVDTQLFGIYKTQNEAYNFAAELKKQGLEPIVEETDNGRWSVKVPKSQLQKKK